MSEIVPKLGIKTEFRRQIGEVCCARHVGDFCGPSDALVENRNGTAWEIRP